MLDIDLYMLKSRDERRAHLDLATDCINLFTKRDQTSPARGILALYLGTTLPSGVKIHACHACNNWKCANQLHLYWGTPYDNHLDDVESGTFKTVKEKTIAKHGQSGWDAFVKRLQATKGNKGSPGKPKKYKTVGWTKENHPRTKRTWSTGSRKGIKMPRGWSRRKKACDAAGVATRLSNE